MTELLRLAELLRVSRPHDALWVAWEAQRRGADCADLVAELERMVGFEHLRWAARSNCTNVGGSYADR